MSAPLAMQPNIRTGMCPHGMPMGACPVCNGGGGGRINSSPSKPQKTGEWSYQKCYLAGLQIKAEAQRNEDARAFAEKQLLSALEMHKNILNIINKMNQFVQNIKNPALRAAVNFIAAISARPFLNILSQLTKAFAAFSNLQQKVLNILMQASEKLAAVLGEIKNFVQKKIFEDLKKKAKKFILIVFSGIEDENFKDDETLAVFKSKELKKHLLKILKKQKDDNSRDN